MPHRCAASSTASKPSSTPSPPARRGHLERKVRQAIQVAPKVRKESKATKDRSARKACPAFKAPQAMMDPSARKASKARPGRKESLEILAAQPAPKVRLEPMERMAVTEPKVRQEK